MNIECSGEGQKGHKVISVDELEEGNRQPSLILPRVSPKFVGSIWPD
jgi:hypothetical protein